MGEEFFFRKTSFFRAKNKTVIRRSPNPNVCLLALGYMQDIKYLGGGSLADLRFVPQMLDVIQDIQENSKDWKCKYRIYMIFDINEKC